jgi:phosphohistidine phosphatase SixA
VNRSKRSVVVSGFSSLALGATALLNTRYAHSKEPIQELSQAALLTALQTGGLVIVIRHAFAPGTFDPVGFKLDDCATQRNLSEQGKAQAVALGQTLETKRVMIDSVYSSQWCRCLDTARLAFARVAVEPASFLNSPTGASSEIRQARLNQWREHIQQFGIGPKKSNNRVYVTHMFNTQDLTGEGIGEGQALVLDPKTVLAKNAASKLIKPVGRLQF